MISADALRKAWGEHARFSPVEPVMTLTEQGLVLGAGNVLVKGCSAGGRAAVAVDGAEERLLALLAIAYGCAVPPSVLGNIRRAVRDWADGEHCLALIHLAHSGLPRLEEGEATPFRLFAAEQLIEAGTSPRRLLELLDLDTSSLDMLKAGFDPDEPRVLAGNPDGGQWTPGGDGVGGSDSGAPSPPEGQGSAGDGGGANDGGGSADGSEGTTADVDETAHPAITSAKYTIVEGLPSDAKAVLPPDGVAIADPDSPTKQLMAPPRADFHEVYAAGRAIASVSYAEQYRIARTAITQEGSYDFQRDVATAKFYHAYIHAANYAVGVYMGGAGYSLSATLAFAKLYAFEHSSNYSVQDRENWITRGWNDANSGRWR